MESKKNQTLDHTASLARSLPVNAYPARLPSPPSVKENRSRHPMKMISAGNGQSRPTEAEHATHDNAESSIRALEGSSHVDDFKQTRRDESPIPAMSVPASGEATSNVHKLKTRLHDSVTGFEPESEPREDNEPLTALTADQNIEDDQPGAESQSGPIASASDDLQDTQYSNRALLSNMMQMRGRSESSDTDFTRDSIASYSQRSTDSSLDCGISKGSDIHLSDDFKALSVSRDRSDLVFEDQDLIDSEGEVVTPRHKTNRDGYNVPDTGSERTPRPANKMSESTLDAHAEPRSKDLNPSEVTIKRLTSRSDEHDPILSSSLSETQYESEDVPSHSSGIGFRGATWQVQGMLDSIYKERARSSSRRRTQDVDQNRPSGPADDPSELKLIASTTQPSPGSSKTSTHKQRSPSKHLSLDRSAFQSFSRSVSSTMGSTIIPKTTVESPGRPRAMSQGSAPSTPSRRTGQYLRSAQPPTQESDTSEPRDLTETEQGLGLTIETGKTGGYSPLPHLPFTPLAGQLSARLLATDVTDKASSAHRNSCPSPVYFDPSHDSERLPITRTQSSNHGSAPTMNRAQHRPSPIDTRRSMATKSTQSSIVSSVSDSSEEHRKLLKRRNTIKELLDTEYSHHQDMKIILDIYKATVGDLISVDDRKALFGNIDAVEAFSLQFYDALKPAVAPFYIPQRSSRWHAKRTSLAPTNTDASEADIVDESDDQQTKVGNVFVKMLPRMEQVYGTYLRNHDVANQRLAKLQTDATVQCWLGECHKNANDITTAWDLDSLLVKPVQRILKYPLLLQQLLGLTSKEHPDRASLEEATKESLNMSQRMNEAKKRAELVEHIVNRKVKDKDIDVRNGIAKAFGRRGDKAKERVGIAEAFQDTTFDELAHKFGGHFIRLQVCMRDIQSSLSETDKAVERFNAFAASLEAYVELGATAHAMTLNKWRKYALAVRELAAVALPEHVRLLVVSCDVQILTMSQKAQIKKRVISPMVAAINLHEGPQNAIAQRKRLLIDHARYQYVMSKGDKPDKKLTEASELYLALNEQLKLDLPRLYALTASLIQACLACHLDLQKEWMWTWENKLRPVVDKFPDSIAEIEPAFVKQYEASLASIAQLQMCNGTLLLEASSLMSPSVSLMDDSVYSRAHSTGGRTLSVGSEASHSMTPDKSRSARASVSLSPMFPTDLSSLSVTQAFATPQRSSSFISQRGRTVSGSQVPSAAPSRMPSVSGRPSYSLTRGPSSSRPQDNMPSPGLQRYSIETGNTSPRPESGASYFTGPSEGNNYRFSSLNSTDTPSSETTSLFPSYSVASTSRKTTENPPVMFVAASLFEFAIDRARKESGYPYLTYVQGEVFDVVAQKGELWLAKNQDDVRGHLGWIWEQHFVILSHEQ